MHQCWIQHRMLGGGGTNYGNLIACSFKKRTSTSYCFENVRKCHRQNAIHILKIWQLNLLEICLAYITGVGVRGSWVKNASFSSTWIWHCTDSIELLMLPSFLSPNIMFFLSTRDCKHHWCVFSSQYDDPNTVHPWSMWPQKFVIKTWCAVIPVFSKVPQKTGYTSYSCRMLSKLLYRGILDVEKCSEHWQALK